MAELFIPKAVAAELGEHLLQQERWLTVKAIHDRTSADELPQKLHLGEREALVLAQELSAPLLIDEREARKMAHIHGISHFGSLRILMRAKEQRLISHLRPVLDDLVAGGTYISKTLYQEFLRQAGGKSDVELEDLE